jgi:hypothetical protein
MCFMLVGVVEVKILQVLLQAVPVEVVQVAMFRVNLRGQMEQSILEEAVEEMRQMQAQPVQVVLA